MTHKLMQKMVAGDPQGAKAERLLQYLSACREGFKLEAASALYGMHPDTAHLDGQARQRLLEQLLRLLLKYQLISLKNQRYHIDKFVIAAARVDAAARQAHYIYYHALADQLDRRGDQRALFVEFANLDIAVENALADQDAYRAFWLANFCYEYLARVGKVRRMINWLEQLKPLESKLDQHTLGALQNARGNAYQDLARTDEPVLYLQKAIEAYEAALSYGSAGTEAVNYAITAQNLGQVYHDLAQLKDTPGNLKRSIEAYQAALRASLDDDSVSHTAVYYHLGEVYRDLAALTGGDQNLTLALEAYQNALNVVKPEYIGGDYAPVR